MQSKRGALAHIKAEIEQRALNAGLTDRAEPIYKATEKRIGELSVQQADLEQEITNLEAKVANPSQIKLTKAEFLKVVKTASDRMKAGSAIEEDALARILLLNVRVDNQKVVDYL